ncbi:MAG TPA: hypothetical protein VGM89_15615 [Puia sp.]|jgi:hypothetical protein
MTAKDKYQLESFLLLVEQMIGQQESYTKAKKECNPGKARDMSNLFSLTRDKVKERIPACRAIITADQGSLF